MNKQIDQDEPFDSSNKPVGLTRIYLAAKNSSRALTWLFKNESAFKQECLLLVLAVPISFLFNVSVIEQIVLVCSVLFVMMVEVVNTAIEVIIDRISLDMHPLSGLAKDLGSAAVSLSLVIMTLTWTGILLL